MELGMDHSHAPFPERHGVFTGVIPGQSLLAIWSTYLEPYCSLIWILEEVHDRPRHVVPQGETYLSAA